VVNDPTTPDRIRRWLLEGRQTGATNVIVVCDTFEYDDYPVFVMPGQNPRDVAKQYDNVNMQKIMEVYSLSLDIEMQLKEHRAFHWD